MLNTPPASPPMIAKPGMSPVSGSAAVTVPTNVPFELNSSTENARSPTTGASLTGVTKISIVSKSVLPTPKPVCPWSSTLICSEALPWKWGAGVNVKPSRAALISASDPTNVIVASSRPSPLPKVNPAVVPRVSVPWVAPSVTITVLAPASTSLIVIGLPPESEKTSGVSSAVTCGAGTWFSGASFTLSTLTATATADEEFRPSETVSISE